MSLEPKTKNFQKEVWMQASKILDVRKRKNLQREVWMQVCRITDLGQDREFPKWSLNANLQNYKARRIQILDKTNETKLQNLRSLCSMLSNLKKRNLFSCWFTFESWESGGRECMEESALVSGQIDTFGNNFLYFLKFTILVGWWTCQLSANVQIDWCCGWCFWCSHFKVRSLKRPRDTLWSWDCTSWTRWWIGAWNFALPKRMHHSWHWH